MKYYRHEIVIDEEEKALLIYRKFKDGNSELYTSIDLSKITKSVTYEDFESFAKQLGENILMDSPVARRLFSL